MKRANTAVAEIVQSMTRVDDFSRVRPRQAQGDRVDREVASTQIVSQRTWSHLRQGPRVRIGLRTCRNEVDPFTRREMDLSRCESLMEAQLTIKVLGYCASEFIDRSLDDNVDIRTRLLVEHRVTDNTSHGTDQTLSSGGGNRRDRRMTLREDLWSTRMQHVTYDPLSDKLATSTQLAMPELIERWKQYEHLTILELTDAFEACEARFREWVRANPDRPISESPDYIDRIALDSLRERRTWWE